MSKSIVIIPTYNEKENVKEIIQAILALSLPFHILIIDDNSPDGTGDIVRSMQSDHSEVHMIQREGKLGLGTAYIAGFKWALEHSYDYIFEMDADFSHDPKDLLRLHEACEKGGADLAIGSRYKSGVNVVNWPLGRVIMSYAASIYVRLVTGMHIRDTTAGLKCYRKEVLRTIELDKIKSKGYAFQIEMKFTAWKFRFTIVEIPIVFTDRKRGSSKMSGGIFNEALWGVIKMKWNSFFSKYERKLNH